MKKGKSEVRIPNKVKYQGDTYKVTFFSWDDWDQDWKEETNRSYKPAAGSYQAVLEKITIAKGVRVSEPACHYQKLKKLCLKNQLVYLEQNSMTAHSFKVFTSRKSKILAYSKKMPKSKDYDFFFQSLFKGNQQRYLF